VLLVLVALPTNLTQRALAAIFGISQPTAHRAIRDLMATIADLFVPGQFGNRDTLIPDRTLIPVHDQAITKPSKNYRRSVNVQVLATLDHQVVHASEAWPGNRNHHRGRQSHRRPARRPHHAHRPRLPPHAQRYAAPQQQRRTSGRSQTAAGTD
jgi:hypothetical protein